MTGPQDSATRTVAALSELPHSIEPARDLWPAIEARLKEIPGQGDARVRLARRGGAQLRWLAAAAMVASVAVGVWIGRSVLPGGTPLAVSQVQPGGTPAGSFAAPGGASALDAAYVSDPRYERQRAQLLRSLQARLAALPPPSRAKVLASLAAIGKAKEDLESALGKDPGNALLQELLIDTYQDEMRVLTDVPEASDSGRGI